ncbi:hypothetical protein [Sphaerochaeta globosa]|uniref:Uncharacterized protein n=1 Tax=Sphaerochaeta globosa (strain ATCC BAA-1886 / DSM 22777 / Buddy) TaxID=158189 RepID=F0RWL9_SPHGB|nr:hypothetical protein [Sphaerochaeta globosa]ADY13650.1 hypothetical protein SpiBuddy_1826 [Sphaerochaeta globosa str. Buddy]
MSVKIPKGKEGCEWCGEDGFITHIDVFGVDRYTVHFQPAKVKHGALSFRPNIIQSEYCLSVEMDGSTLARVLCGETITLDTQEVSNARTVYVVVSGDDEDWDVECVMSDKDLAQRYCDIKNITFEYPYCRVYPYVVDGVTVGDAPVMQARYYLQIQGDVDGAVSYGEVYEHQESFMESEDVFACTVDFNNERSVMGESVLKKYKEFIAAKEGL